MAIKEYGREYFWGACRRLLEKIIPITSSLYKLFYLNAYKFQSRTRNKRRKNFSFQVHIVDSCNLNCGGCSTFAPLCKNSFINVNSFERDIKQITALGQVEKMVLIGGEPLLHPNIIDIIEISRKYIKETGELLIATNGVLLSEQNPKFWESCKANNVKITITPYPINLNYERIDKIAKEYAVDLTFFYIGDKISFVKIPLNIEGKGNIVKTFKKCSSSHCVTLRESKMYSCYRPSLVDFFNNYFGQNFKVSEKDYIDIFAKDKDEILDFICKPTPFCRYCDIESMEFGIKWRMSKKEIKEWT